MLVQYTIVTTVLLMSVILFESLLHEGVRAEIVLFYLCLKFLTQFLVYGICQ